MFTSIDRNTKDKSKDSLKKHGSFLLSFLDLSFESGIQTWNNTVAFADSLK